MKKFRMQRSTIIIAQVEYYHKTHTSREAFNAFVKTFPEYATCKYEDTYIGHGKSMLDLYREECVDFVEM